MKYSFADTGKYTSVSNLLFMKRFKEGRSSTSSLCINKGDWGYFSNKYGKWIGRIIWCLRRRKKKMIEEKRKGLTLCTFVKPVDTIVARRKVIFYSKCNSNKQMAINIINYAERVVGNSAFGFYILS